jgi:hypothetical protein
MGFMGIDQGDPVLPERFKDARHPVKGFLMIAKHGTGKDSVHDEITGQDLVLVSVFLQIDQYGGHAHVLHMRKQRIT